jgi:hypothetical protein
MHNLALPASLLLALVPTTSAATAQIDGVALAQLTIHQRIVIRIPRVLGARTAQRSEPAPQRWNEKKGRNAWRWPQSRARLSRAKTAWI